MKIDPSPAEFVGKVVLITGAGSGIGLATARLLAESGATVVGVEFVAERVQEFNSEFGANGDHTCFEADVRDFARTQQLFEEIVMRYGRLDAMVLSAGLNGPMGRLDAIHPDEVQALFEANVVALFNYMNPAVSLLEASQGSVVLVGSINGSRNFSWAGASPYVASKAAVMALGRNWAVELGPRGIRVNTVCPGQVETNINSTIKWRGEGPVGRPKKYPEGSMPLTGWKGADPVDVAEAIRYLVSAAAKHVTGTEIFIDAGQSLS